MRARWSMVCVPGLRNDGNSAGRKRTLPPPPHSARHLGSSVQDHRRPGALNKK
jgi:hypothetical protein